jgi:hypothetical protein
VQELIERRAAAPEFPCGAGGLGGHSRVRRRASRGRGSVASLELVTSALRDSISETLIQLKRRPRAPGHHRSRPPRSSACLARWPESSTLSGTSQATGSGGMSVVSGGIA